MRSKAPSSFFDAAVAQSQESDTARARGTSACRDARIQGSSRASATTTTARIYDTVWCVLALLRFAPHLARGARTAHRARTVRRVHKLLRDFATGKFTYYSSIDWLVRTRLDDLGV